MCEASGGRPVRDHSHVCSCLSPFTLRRYPSQLVWGVWVVRLERPSPVSWIFSGVYSSWSFGPKEKEKEMLEAHYLGQGSCHRHLFCSDCCLFSMQWCPLFACCVWWRLLFCWCCRF